MSQIPGFSLGALGPNTSQPPQPSLPPNLNMLTPQQQALLAQHQQQQLRQQQSSPHQHQGLPVVTNPDNQRMWQAMDQQVRAHNDATQVNPTYNQIADFLRAGGVSQSQHTQQPRLQSFPQLQQQQNPSTNAGSNPMHQGMNLNTSVPQFNTLGGLPQTAAQLQLLTEHNPAMRAAIQQHQQHQRLQAQQRQQQQHQQQQPQQQQPQQQPQTVGAGSPFDPISLGFNMPVPSPNQAPHPMTPANSNALANPNAAEMTRQFHLMSRAGQHQGQNGNSLTTLSQGASIMNRQQQPGQQNSPFSQAQIPNGGSLQMGSHAGQQGHPNTNQQQHLNRQMFPTMAAQFPSGTVPNMANTLGGGGHHPQQQHPPNQQPPQQSQPGQPPLDRQKLEQLYAALPVQIQHLQSQLLSTGFTGQQMNPTDEQRALVLELQTKKGVYQRLTQQFGRVSQQGLPGPSQGGGEGGLNVTQNRPGIPPNLAQNPKMIQNWLEHNLQQPPKVNTTPGQISSRPPNPGQQVQGPSSPFQQQQLQLAQYQQQQQQQQQHQHQQQHQQQQQQHQHQHQQQQQQQHQQQQHQQQQQTLHHGPAHVIHQQQQLGVSQQMIPQSTQQQQPPMFVGGQSQPSAAHRPPTTPPQQQPQPFSKQINGIPIMDRGNFESNLKGFLARSNILTEANRLKVDNKEVDLYELHLDVLKHGGSHAVDQHNLWPTITANLGFVQFQATATEPARASQQTAVQIANVYKRYLSHWESFIMTKLTQDRRRAATSTAPGGVSQQPSGGPQQVQQQPQQSQQLQQLQQPQQPQQLQQRPPAANTYPFLQNPSMAAQPQQPQIPDTQRQQPQGQQVPQSTPHLGFRPGLSPATFARFAHMSREQMQKHGLPEPDISFIETHRQQLQQREQHQQLRAAANAQASRPQQPVPAVPNLPPGPQQMHTQSQQGPIPPTSNLPVLPQAGRLIDQRPPVNQVLPIPAQKGVVQPTRTYSRPTHEQLRAAIEYVRSALAEYTAKHRTFVAVVVQEHEKGSYMQHFDHLWRAVHDAESKLPMFHALFGEEASTTKLVTMIMTTKEQRKLLATPAAPPQYILTMFQVRSLLTDLHSMMSRFFKVMANLPPAPPSLPKPPGPTPSIVENQRPPSVQMQHASQASPPTQHTRAAPPPSTQQIAKAVRKPGLPPTATTPSPAAQTPAQAATTPPTIAASSPRTPKSPPKRAVPKPKPQPKRKVSKAGPLVPPDIGTSKPTGTKRPREDEPASQGTPSQPQAADDGPSPKRPKREDWDGLPNEELEKRQLEVNSVESIQDVQTYLARATEDFLVSGNAEGNEGSTNDLSKTIQELFKGVPMSDVPDSFPGPPAESAVLPSSPKPSDNAFDLFDFFDFSKCEEPVTSTSKIDTPDLVHGSSTNTNHESVSPESVAETPKGDHAAIASSRAKDVKIAEDTSGPNPLALGVWEEISGGEPAYYDHPGYKWEGDMVAPDVPWAMSAGS